MNFKAGDRIEIIGTHYRKGALGTVVQVCEASHNCRIIRFVDGSTRHVFTFNLTPQPVKNQQLLFSFMSEAT